jgi:molybdopterin-guanine dinucleotide biosynthesis protein A
MDISCAITAGGKAKRFNGITKAFLKVDGKRIIDKNLEILSPIFNDIVLISNSPNVFSAYKEFRIFSDYYKGIGPLAGLHSALKNCKQQSLFILSSDLPNISPEIIIRLIDKYQVSKCDALIPKIGNKIEPLFGIYSKGILRKLESFIEKGESFAMRDFFKEINTEFLILEDTYENIMAFKNINSPKDL